MPAIQRTTEERKHALLTLAMLMFQVTGVAVVLKVKRSRVAAWMNADNAMPEEFDRALGRHIKARANIWAHSRDPRKMVVAAMVHRELKRLHPSLYSKALAYQQLREAVLEYLADGPVPAYDVVEHFALQGISRRSLYNAVSGEKRITKKNGEWSAHAKG